MERNAKKFDSNSIGIYNVVQRLRKGAVQKGRGRGKQFVPPSNQKRLIDYYKIRKITASQKERNRKLQAKGTAGNGLWEAIGDGKAKEKNNASGGTGGFAKSTLSKPPRKLKRLDRGSVAVKKRQPSKKKVEKSADADVYSIGDDCWGEVMKHLKIDPDGARSAPNIINIKMIRENAEFLESGRIIPMLFAVIVKLPKGSNKIKDGTIVRVADYTGSINLVLQERDTLKYGPLLTLGSVLVLTNVRLQTFEEKHVIVVPLGGLCFVATKARENYGLYRKPFYRVGKKVVIMKIGDYDHQLLAMAVSFMQPFEDFEVSQNDEEEHGEVKEADKKVEKGKPVAEKDDWGSEEYDAIMGDLEMPDVEGKPLKEEIINQSEAEWGDDSFEAVMGEMEMPYEMMDVGESKLVGGKGRMEKENADVFSQDSKTGEDFDWADEEMDLVMAQLVVPEIQKASSVEEKVDQNMWGSDDDEYDDVMRNVEDF